MLRSPDATKEGMNVYNACGQLCNAAFKWVEERENSCLTPVYGTNTQKPNDTVGEMNRKRKRLHHPG